MTKVLLIIFFISYVTCFQITRNKQYERYIYAQDKDKDMKKISPLPKIKLSELFTLISMGAGAPSLGEFKKIDENGKMWFEVNIFNLLF